MVSWVPSLVLACVFGLVASDPPQSTLNADSSHARPPGMVWIPAGTFTMGWDGPEGRPDERPAHQVHLDGFWIDATEVTNAQFAEFVEATGYRTTAERPIDWNQLRAQLPPGTPKPSEDQLQPGSMVFTPPADEARTNLREHTTWWRWVPGAHWRQPEGPGSTIEDRQDHPVVHVSWDDAVAFAQWAGKQLPSEAQWERAARSGQDGQRYAWGEALTPRGVHHANIWQGIFPTSDICADGHASTAPVGSYPPNAAGLYDMSGNIWEWTRDQFRTDTYQRRMQATQGECCINPTGPLNTADPRMPHAQVTRVQKGGSFLCHPSYCSSYRPSAKMSSTPDSSMNHLGFRCVSTTVPGLTPDMSQKSPEAEHTYAPSDPASP